MPNLLAMRPIVAHSPPNCNFTRWLKEHDCAEVIDQPDSAALEQAIERVRHDAARRETLRAQRSGRGRHVPRPGRGRQAEADHRRDDRHARRAPRRREARVILLSRQARFARAAVTAMQTSLPSRRAASENSTPSSHGMAPKRILFLINTLGTGGWERDVAMICRHIDKSRFLPEVWTLRPGGENESVVREAGIVVCSLDRRHAGDPFFGWRAARALAKTNFDLWHAFLPAILYYAAFARTIHRVKAPLMYSEGTIGVSYRWRAPIFRWAIRRHCSGFTANSLSSQAFLTAQGIPAEKITIVPNGHEFSRFRSPLDRQEARSSLGIAARAINNYRGPIDRYQAVLRLDRGFLPPGRSIPPGGWHWSATARTGRRWKIKFINKNCKK